MYVFDRRRRYSRELERVFENKRMTILFFALCFCNAYLIYTHCTYTYFSSTQYNNNTNIIIQQEVFIKGLAESKTFQRVAVHTDRHIQKYKKVRFVLFYVF